MANYKPRNANYRHGQGNTAPLAWAQAFHDSRPPRKPEVPCGFAILENDR